MAIGDVNLVLKYCEALDEFLRIRVCSETEAKALLANGCSGDRAAYQLHVMQHTLLDFNPGLSARLESVKLQGTVADIDEVLYLLSVDVNPGLDIHQVSIPLMLADVCKDEELDALSQPAPKSKKQLERVMVMDRELKKRIVGQDSAVEIVSRAMKKAAVGLRDPRRPIGAFLCVGHVGVGKTELAKSLTEYLYGTQTKLIRVDCSEYALPHEYAKLIGSPPGYIGHNEGGYLTEAAKEMDEFVVLFDEIEKAHSKMHNILLQLLDEGMVTDSKGFKVSFRNALVLMTSNIGVREVEDARGAIGFDSDARENTSYERHRSAIDEALKKCFRPEFLNRLDEVIVFNTLTRDDSVRIVDIMLGEMGRIAKRAGINLHFDASVKRTLAEKGWRKECGARELRRTLKQQIETPLTDLLLDGTIREGMDVRVRARAGEISFEPQHLETPSNV
ncbi:MAG: ATP-dependent Clp protease ATP-binding subunit [Planctomycetes bacterium]|nr:ATP-dependent Clp protease ATP-binding subunit [Planctomycetota bacterium]